MKNERACRPIWVEDGEHRASLIIEWGAWLPLELNPIYREAVEFLRSYDRRVVQVRDLFSTDGLRLMSRLIRATLTEAIALGATDIVAVVSPRHARKYAAMHFIDMLPDDAPRVWDLARDRRGDFLKTRLIRLDITALDAETRARWTSCELRGGKHNS